jgi:NADPH-dependent ferric siderophore reductase
MSDSASSQAAPMMGYHESNSIAGVARVIRAEYVTPRVRRLTVTSDELAKLPEDLGWNRPFRAYFSTPGFYDQIYAPALQDDGMYADTFALEQEHAEVRAYTMRRLDIPARELDVDFVLHDDGVASKWAESAEEGSGFGFLISTMEMFTSGLPDVDCMLLIGDDTAIPHIANVLGALPEGFRAVALLEVTDEDDEQPLGSDGDVTVQWIHRQDQPAGASRQLQEAVRSLVWPQGTVHAYVAAERGAVGDIRGYLRDERGFVRRKGEVFGHAGPHDADVGKSTYEVQPYWRLGTTTTDEVRAGQADMGKMMEKFKAVMDAGGDPMDVLDEEMFA